MLALVDVTRSYESAVRRLALGPLRRSWVLVLTRRGSPVAGEFRRLRAESPREGRDVALAYMVSGASHPRAVGEWEFELAPSQPQVVGMVTAAVESRPRGVMVVLDSLTDLCTLNGLGDTRELVRNLLRTLRAVDALVALMVRWAHPAQEVRSFARLMGVEEVLEFP